MYDPGRQSANFGFLWSAFAAAMMSDAAGILAKQFADLAVGPPAPAVPEPKWATAHSVAVELKTVTLQDFTSDAKSSPVLLCVPFALHGAGIADFAPGHSLVGALRRHGVRRLFVTDWRSANPQMRFRGIDDYLADLNVLIDDIGPPLDLIGLCQGGWMALVYAARFPAKVRKLVLVGAPIDTSAGPSPLSMLADSSPAALFDQLVRVGDGVVPGSRVLKFWGAEMPAAADVRALLQTTQAVNSAAFAELQQRFKNWYYWTLDLPGTFFLETVDRLYKRNELASGGFVALGQKIDLKRIKAPLVLLAARDDELVAPPQLFAAARLVGTAAEDIQRLLAPGRHVSLFMGRRTLEDLWPRIARWLIEPQRAARGPFAGPALERAS